MTLQDYKDSAKIRYRENRKANWDNVAHQPRKAGAFYHKLLQHYYKFLIPSGQKILQLGCGHGDLLASLSPSVGIGVDFSEEMVKVASAKHRDLKFVCADVHDLEIQDKFDVIILSDLVNDLWDVQQVFEKLHQFCHPNTRIVLNFYNNLWRIPLTVVRKLGLGAKHLEQNWFSPHDVANLMKLSGFEVIKRIPAILLPLFIPILTLFLNRFLANLAPFSWFDLTNFMVARPVRPKQDPPPNLPSVSVIIPARNEAGNIDTIIKRTPDMGSHTEIVFVEGNSTDNTYDTIVETIPKFADRDIKVFKQTGKGKGDAVRLGFTEATCDILMILDADMTVPPEDLPRFYDALVSGKGEFINGVRLVYPLEDEAMRFFNILGNKFFSIAFSWLLGQQIKDTLCGTKVLHKTQYQALADNRSYFGDFDPFGDFDLLFGAAKLNLKITEIPIRYRSRTYGDTNIDRWRHGWLLLKMVVFAAKRIKFI